MLGDTAFGSPLADTIGQTLAKAPGRKLTISAGVPHGVTAKALQGSDMAIDLSGKRHTVEGELARLTSEKPAGDRPRQMAELKVWPGNKALPRCQ